VTANDRRQRGGRRRVVEGAVGRSLEEDQAHLATVPSGHAAAEARGDGRR